MGAKNERESGEIYVKSLPFLPVSMPVMVPADHYTFMGNCPPTPPLTATLTLTSHLGQNVGLGEG